jgi:hypothetical protein
MRPKWILPLFVGVAGLGAVQANAQTTTQTPAAQLTCTSASGVLTFNLIGYDLDVKKSTSTGSGAGSATPQQFTAYTKLDQNFLALFRFYALGSTFSHCDASRSSNPGYKATLTTVSVSELQVIDNVPPQQNGNRSTPYVEIVLSMASFEIETLEGTL